MAKRPNGAQHSQESVRLMKAKLGQNIAHRLTPDCHSLIFGTSTILRVVVYFLEAQLRELFLTAIAEFLKGMGESGWDGPCINSLLEEWGDVHSPSQDGDVFLLEASEPLSGGTFWPLHFGLV